MAPIIRATAVYLFLLLVFRIAGKRSLGSVTTFDLVLTLIISEAVQQALIDNDNSLTNAVLLVTTLIGLNVAFSLLKQRSPRVDRWMEGNPVVLMRDGKLLEDAMRRERVDELTILGAARERHGIPNLDHVAFAVVETDGKVSVIPWDRLSRSAVATERPA
jgi:uncharacterized membrane protein YcaP (DUF421 family)